MNWLFLVCSQVADSDAEFYKNMPDLVESSGTEDSDVDAVQWSAGVQLVKSPTQLMGDPTYGLKMLKERIKQGRGFHGTNPTAHTMAKATEALCVRLLLACICWAVPR